MKHKLVDKYFTVLDEGFIALKDVMGTDEDIEAAARVSYQKGTRKISDTRKLLRYCMSHKHTSIFEQAILKFHVKAPILTFRQWHRHRTWSFNEMSGRYSILPDECLKTSNEEWRNQSKSNKQGSGDFIEDWPEGWRVDENGTVYGPDCSFSSIDDISTPGKFLSNEEENIQKSIRDVYERRIDLGVAREQARKELPVSQYSEMYATVNLHNLLHFVTLRSDSHSQQEIRDYSNIIAGVVKILFPLTFEAWYEYTYNSTTFSLLDRKFLSYLMEKYTFDDFAHLREKHEFFGDQYPISILGMTKREVSDFWGKFEINEKQNFDLEL